MRNDVVCILNVDRIINHDDGFEQEIKREDGVDRDESVAMSTLKRL